MLVRIAEIAVSLILLSGAWAIRKLRICQLGQVSLSLDFRQFFMDPPLNNKSFIDRLGQGSVYGIDVKV